METSHIRDRLQRKIPDLNSSTVSSQQNRSIYEDKMSPLCRKAQDSDRFEKMRVTLMMSRIKLYAGVLAVIVIDALVTNSTILSFLLVFNTLSRELVSNIAICSSILLILAIIAMTIEAKYPSCRAFFAKIFISFEPKVDMKAANKPNLNDSTYLSGNSTADFSWVDAHKFGTPRLDSVVRSDLFNTSRKSPNTSAIFTPHSTPMDTSATHESSVWKSPTAFGKASDSIHTRKQLDVLLRSHEKDTPVDVNTSQTYFSSIWNVFDFSRSGQNQYNNSYHLSEEIEEDADKLNSSYRMKVGRDGRTEVKMMRRRRGGENDTEEDNDDELTKLHKILNAARTTPDKTGILKRSNSMERGGLRSRRRSHSSPDRTTDFLGGEQDSRYRSGETLTDEEQKRAEFRVRTWIRNTIILPLVKHIDAINGLLEKEHANPALKIGVSSVDALKLAAIERDSLKSTSLPFLLPFLSVHTNQAYLVDRIRELSRTEFMDVYKWNGGGMEPAEDKLQKSRFVRREWNDSLPTDAILVFDLFSAYMDAQINSNCLVGDNRIDQPFTSKFVVKYPKKPMSQQRIPFGFYIHLALTNPPHFEFIYHDEHGSMVKCPIVRQTSNLFRAIAQFVHFAKEENHGYLDRTSIGPAGINIISILN